MAGINFTDEREYTPKLTFKNNDAIHNVSGSTSRFNVYKDGILIGQDYLSGSGKWMHKWMNKGQFERGGWPGRCEGEDQNCWTYEALSD